jgi:hypothetical protein
MLELEQWVENSTSKEKGMSEELCGDVCSALYQLRRGPLKNISYEHPGIASYQQQNLGFGLYYSRNGYKVPGLIISFRKP